MMRPRRMLAWSVAIPFMAIGGPLTGGLALLFLLMLCIWVIGIAFMLAIVHTVDPSFMKIEDEGVHHEDDVARMDEPVGWH